MEAWKNMEKEGIDRVNEENVTIALQNKPNVSGFEVQTKYKETQMIETDDTIEAVIEKNFNLSENKKNEGY